MRMADDVCPGDLENIFLLQSALTRHDVIDADRSIEVSAYHDLVSDRLALKISRTRGEPDRQ